MGMKPRNLGILALMVLGLGAGGWSLLSRQRETNAVTLKTARVTRGTVTTSVSGTGVLDALTTVEVKSNVGGQLVYLGVDEGDTVTTGQIIARIDPADAQSALEQSQAEVESAHSKVSQARQGLSMQRVQTSTQIQAAEKAVDAARVRLSQAEKQAHLQETLTDTAIEGAHQTLAAARARLVQAEEGARIQPQLTETAIQQAKLSLASAQSTYQQTKNALVPQKLSAAKTALQQAIANTAYAEKELARLRQLFAKGYVPRAELDAAEQRATVAGAQRDGAQQKVDTIVEETRDDLEAAQARVAQADAALRTAETNRAQDTLKQQEVLSTRAAVRQAEAGVKSAEANRIQNTLKVDDIASARAALAQAQAALETTRANSYQTLVKEGDIIQASAQVKRTEASLTNARTQLGYTTITAPRAGIVVKKYIEAGSIVAGARTSLGGAGTGVTLMEIADVSRMYATVNIDETDIAQIRVGQEVEVNVDAFSDELFIGTVTKIAPRTITEQNVTTIPVTVEIEVPDLRLKPGMNATCDFVTARHRDTLIVPNAAVKRGDQGAIVTVVVGGKPTPRPVQLGLADTRGTEILDGLSEGETVVTAVIDPRQQVSPTGMSPGGAGGGGMRSGGMRGMRPF
jgi:HlyD family secretion protein